MNSKRLFAGLFILFVVPSFVWAAHPSTGPYFSGARPYGGGIGPYFSGIGYGGWGYGLSDDCTPDRLPYYTLYPPVYYGDLERRSFGQSPFAWQTWPVIPTTPQPAAAAFVPAPPSSPPLRIVNPYVQTPGGLSSVPPAAKPLKPAVVHPASAQQAAE